MSKCLLDFVVLPTTKFQPKNSTQQKIMYCSKLSMTEYVKYMYSKHIYAS